MSDKPILFSAPMVRAILDGRKTVTRRILKDVPPSPAMDAVHPRNQIKHPAPYLDSYCGDRKTEKNSRGMSERWCWWTRDDRRGLPTFKVRWVPGDRLWVREAWGYNPDHPSVPEFSCFRADPGHEHDGIRWRPSIHMPRWASRITLEVTDVRVERLQDITEADARAEGISDGGCLNCGNPEPCGCAAPQPDARDAYVNLWDRINGPGSWEANPWIVAVEFRRIANAE